MASLAEQIAYNDRKLAHYNAWLLDTTREAGKPYPGFPEDIERRAAKKAAKTVTKVTTKSPKAPVKAKRTRGGETKLDKAKALFKANSKLSRENMIGLFMEQLQMSKAGATTYIYNCKKAAGY
jgi:hypothetical protein